MNFADGPEEPLHGGDVTQGVVRIGDTVRRPRQPHSTVIEELLTYLEQVGFDGSPRFLGFDRQGRQALTFMPGEVAGRPWPAWVADERRIVSVAELVRRYDDAAQGFGLPASVEATRRPDVPGAPPSIAGPATFVGHLDLTPENIVFAETRAAALIDFDLARPTDRVSEVCNMLLWWVPLMPVADREVAVREVDCMARAASMVDAYGLADHDRARVVDVAVNAADRSWFSMRSRAMEIGGGWRRMWDDGVGDRIRRRREWLIDESPSLHKAVTEGR